MNRLPWIFGLFARCCILTMLVMFISMEKVSATHLRAGEIIVERVNCQSLTFRITITVYTNTGSSVLFGGRTGEDDILDFGDGVRILVPETPNTLRPDLGENIGTASYTVFHTYPGPGKYTISYREPNRNEGVLNMDNSVNTRFYIETVINIDPFLGCNNTPKLLIPPIDVACPGVTFFHNPGAADPDGDSLSYELVIPFSDRNQTVIRYQDPSANSPRNFYTNYPNSNEDGDGPPSFVIDPVTGTITWDAPGAQGEYNIAFVIKEWRNIGGQWFQLGFVRRDMQILVEDCDNERPDLIVPNDTCVEAGTVLNATIFGIDPENHDVKIEAFSEIFILPGALSPATYSPNPPELQPSNPPAELQFEWQTECIHVKNQPYQVVFKITDDPPNGPKLVTFKTWNITVVGPAPQWVSADVDLANRHTNLEWEPYVCENAEVMQVWRRVDSFPYDPANCETGMPEFLGYTLIAELPLNGNTPVTNYLDTNGGQGLAPGAEYCYRLVAVFPLPKGGESYMSEEICIPPILADAPVITNVSVLKTDPSDGEIEVKWLPPFEIDPVQFPPPYEYVVERAEGFAGGSYVAAHTGRLPETTLTIVDNAINTENLVFNYRILLYVPSVSATTPVDTSAAASSVRLEATSQLDQIQLNWSAFVPWSNQTQAYPTHDVYRGPEGATEADLILISSVNVNLEGFTFLDTDVDQSQVYCYRVMTRGAYGNPDIPEPLENFSQIICAQPGDEEPPCQPSVPLAVSAPDCESYTDRPDFSCRQNTFSNRIEWERPDDTECRNDIVSYNVYVSPVQGGNFELWATNIRDTFYEDLNLPSYAKCYRISAVDRSGNESELSDPICVDNCPYYELPNIFTPNGDCWNSLFSAYSDRDVIGENGNPECSIPPESQKKCARFVEKVVFTVFNRWGKEVYSYVGQVGSENTIYIDWDGRDNDGRDLSTGIYYYSADVTFVTVDPDKRNQTLKGWVHLLR